VTAGIYEEQIQYLYWWAVQSYFAFSETQGSRRCAVQRGGIVVCDPTPPGVGGSYYQLVLRSPAKSTQLQVLPTYSHDTRFT